MTARLAALAAALLIRLGFPLLPLAESSLLTPVVAPLFTGGPAWLPLVPLGLPGHYTPQTGGEP